jgi:hypothetical protein
MPLIRIDALTGRTTEEIKLFSTRFTVPSYLPSTSRNATAIRSTTNTPPPNLVVQDTGLGIGRSSKVVLISVFSKQRSREAKLALYAALCRKKLRHPAV